MTDNVVHIKGGVMSSEPLPPNPRLIAAIEALLEMAQTGQLQSLIGTGFTQDGMRVTTFADYHVDVYQMLGALAWLEHEYVHQHTTLNKPE